MIPKMNVISHAPSNFDHYIKIFKAFREKHVLLDIPINDGFEIIMVYKMENPASGIETLSYNRKHLNYV